VSARDDHASGCLVGQAIGDALGYPVEGLPPAAAAMWADTLRDDLDGALDDEFLGQYTDDTQLARELAISIAEHGRLRPEDFARRTADIFRADAIVGRGIATHRAAMRLIEGVPWDRAGEPPPSAGNGTAMRAGPIGLLHPNDPTRLVEDATTQSIVTHQDERCAAGSIAIAAAVALAMRDDPIEPEGFCGRLAALVAPCHAGFAEHLRAIPGLLGLPVADASAAIAPMGLEADELGLQLYEWAGISPFVIPSVVWSLWAFLRSPEDLFEAVCLAIEPGGDVDTTGAMTGAVVGARVGLAAIDPRLRDLPHDHGAWGADDLAGLARDVAAIGSA
jgi:ADP-ribosylglycohydrolase